MRLDIVVLRKGGGSPQRVEPKWSRLQSIPVVSSPFESICVEVGVIESLYI